MEEKTLIQEMRYWHDKYIQVWIQLQDALMRDGSHTKTIALTERGS